MSKAESADLILKLYDLRREDKNARSENLDNRIFPESAADIIQAMIKPETSAYYRMVTTYWDMASSFVNHAAIDEEMFADAHGEHIAVFAKIEPFLAELREMMGNPNVLKNLESLIMRQPDAKERLNRSREMMKRMAAMRSEAAQKA